MSAATAHLEAVAKRLQLVNRQIADADLSVCHPNLLRRSWALAHSAQLDRWTEKLAEADDAPGQDKEQRDVTILRSLPGVGRVVIATLLAEASEALQQRDYQALRCLSGVATVTKRSGMSCIVLTRQAANVRLRNAVYHWARRRSARSQLQSQVHGSAITRARAGTGSPIRCRPAARRGLRHAEKPVSLRPDIHRGKKAA